MDAANKIDKKPNIGEPREQMVQATREQRAEANRFAFADILRQVANPGSEQTNDPEE